MTEYLTAPIDIDQTDVLQLAYDYIQAVFPNWVPADGNLDTALLEAISTDAASLRELAADVPSSIFRWFGATLMGIQPIDATPAISTVTFHSSDSLGHTIPAGTQVAIPTSDASIVFETLTDAVIPAASSLVAGVSIEAVDPGSAASGIGSVNEVIQLIDALVFISSVTLDNPTTGGLDAEDDDTYLDRLTTELRLISPRLIIPSDFAAGALNIPGVERALAIDGYDPGTATFNNPREVSVAAVDVAGNAVSAGIKSQLAAYFAANREVNFIANVIDPTYTSIDVTFAVTALTGWDKVAVHDAIIAAVRAWLDPSAWGQDPTVRDVSGSGTWVSSPKVRYIDLVSLVRGVGGVAYVNSLTFAITPGAQGTADITLPGVAPLTTPGTVVGTVA